MRVRTGSSVAVALGPLAALGTYATFAVSDRFDRLSPDLRVLLLSLLMAGLDRPRGAGG